MVRAVLSAVWRHLPKQARRWIVRRLEPHFTVATGVVVQDDDQQILLLRHVFRPGSGWGIPGGFIARGEQPDEAVRRELREEIDVELRDLELAFVRTLTVTNQVEVIFRARTDATPRVRARLEVSEIGWFALDALPEGISADQRAVITRAVREGSVSTTR